MAESPSHDSPAQPADPLRRDIRTPGTWLYVVNYLVLGSCAVLITLELVESGAWRKLGLPLFWFFLAIGNLARLNASRRRPALTDADWRSLADDPAKKIAAIKLYRQIHGAGLAEAKEAVEAYVQSKANQSGADAEVGGV